MDLNSRVNAKVVANVDGCTYGLMDGCRNGQKIKSLYCTMHEAGVTTLLFSFLPFLKRESTLKGKRICFLRSTFFPLRVDPSDTGQMVQTGITKLSKFCKSIS